MKLEIERIGVLTLGGFTAVLFFILSLLSGLPLVFLLRAIARALGRHTGPAPINSILVLVLVGALLWGVVGGILGMVAAFLYNTVSQFSGGVTVSVTEHSE